MVRPSVVEGGFVLDGCIVPDQDITFPPVMHIAIVWLLNFSGKACHQSFRRRIIHTGDRHALAFADIDRRPSGYRMGARHRVNHIRLFIPERIVANAGARAFPAPGNPVHSGLALDQRFRRFIKPSKGSLRARERSSTKATAISDGCF